MPAQSISSKGFSLVELLAVISIMLLLIVGAVPAFNAVTGAHGVTRATYDVTSLLELARSEAVTKQTYVWVGFGNSDNGLIAGAVYSRDGSGTNIDPTNLAALTRSIRIDNVALVSWNDLKPATQALFAKQLQANSTTSQGVATPVSVAANTASISFNVGRLANFKNAVITFTPRGEAMLKCLVGPDDGFDPFIDVSLRQMRGKIADDAAIMIQGATGTPSILQLQ